MGEFFIAVGYILAGGVLTVALGIGSLLVIGSRIRDHEKGLEDDLEEWVHPWERKHDKD